MYRPSSDTVIDIGHVIESLPDHIIRNLLAIHASSGCDTVSSLFGMGKLKVIKMCEKSNNSSLLDIFGNSSASKEDIIREGLKFVKTLYRGAGNLLKLWRLYDMLCTA